MYKRKQDTAKVIKDQLHQAKMNYIKKLKDEVLEGELIKRKARDDLEASRLAELERKAKQARTRDELDRANQELKAYKEEVKRKEEENERLQSEYAKKREQVEQLKKDREAQRFKEKQDIREKMIEK